MMALTTSATIESITTTSISIFGSRLTSYSCPRYMAVWPFCLPCPRTSVTVRPEAPICSSASLTSSTLFGRTMALISCIHLLQSSATALLAPVEERDRPDAECDRRHGRPHLEEQTAAQDAAADEELPVHHCQVIPTTNISAIIAASITAGSASGLSHVTLRVLSR